MNTKEATALVRQQLMEYRRMTYVDLCRLVDMRLPTLVLKGASGAKYQIAVRVNWEGTRGGDIRVIGLIDDGGWRVFVPLSQDFMTGPDNVISATWQADGTSHGESP